MAIDTYTPLFSEILGKVSKLKTKKEKVAHLQQYNTDSLRMVIKSSFDPLKYFSSVSTDIQEIPFFSYCLANSIKLILLLTISPAEGLDLFSSPIIEIF